MTATLGTVLYLGKVQARKRNVQAGKGWGKCGWGAFSTLLGSRVFFSGGL